MQDAPKRRGSVRISIPDPSSGSGSFSLLRPSSPSSSCSLDQGSSGRPRASSPFSPFSLKDQTKGNEWRPPRLPSSSGFRRRSSLSPSSIPPSSPFSNKGADGVRRRPSLGGGTYQPSHDRGRTALSREEKHELGKNYLQERRSKSPFPESCSPKPIANPVLHHLRNWTAKSPAATAALHLRGPHAKSLGSADLLVSPISPPELSTTKGPVTGEELRASIDAAFDMVDTDGNGTIDRAELKQIMSAMCGNLRMDLTEDSVDAIFGEIDTDNSGDISPLEFRVFLERTLVEAEARGRQLDLQTLVSTSFHDALVRAKRDHNIALGTFLKASKVFMCDETGAAQVGQSSRVFDIFRRLMGCPINASLLDSGDRGRVAFIIKALREILSLSDVVLAVPLPNEPAEGKARQRAARLIRGALFGRPGPEGDQSEETVSAVSIFRFVQEWLNRIDEWELESAKMGQQMGQLGSRWMSVKRDLLSTTQQGAKKLSESQEAFREPRPRSSSVPNPPPVRPQSAKKLAPLSPSKPEGPPASRAATPPLEILSPPKNLRGHASRIPRNARRRSMEKLEYLLNDSGTGSDPLDVTLDASRD